jgi:3-hydroxyisobutyrate dehydrogenase-like beta-hydroxyacid dehydrogenase
MKYKNKKLKSKKSPCKYTKYSVAGRSVQFVDAPVSGGVNAAAAGTLTFMVGADSEVAFATAKQILESMGAKVRFRTICLAFQMFEP